MAKGSCPLPQKDGYPEFDNRDSETRFKEAMEGETNKGVVERFKESTAASFKAMTRKFPDTKESGFNADFLEGLRKVEAADNVAQEDITKMFNTVMGGLNEKQAEFMTRAIVLDDLYWTAAQGMELPFGFKDQKDVGRELAKVRATLSKNPELQQRLDHRKNFMDDLRSDLIGSGVLGPDQVRNQNYFRHKVLEYHALKRAGAAEAGGTKLSKAKWAKRRGSVKDISANYLEVEAEVILKSRRDIAAARFINGPLAKYDKFAEYSDMARSSNNAVAMDSLREELMTALESMSNIALPELERTVLKARANLTPISTIVKEFGAVVNDIGRRLAEPKVVEFMKWAEEMDTGKPVNALVTRDFLMKFHDDMSPQLNYPDYEFTNVSEKRPNDIDPKVNFFLSQANRKGYIPPKKFRDLTQAYASRLVGGAHAGAYPYLATTMPHLNTMNQYRIAIGSSIMGIRNVLLKLHPDEFRMLPGSVKDAVIEAMHSGGNKDLMNYALNKINMLEFAKWSMVTQFEPTVGMAGKLMSAISNRRVYFRDRLVGDEFINPQASFELLRAFGDPETEAVWQPDAKDGNTRAMHMFHAKTIPEHVIDRVADELANWSIGAKEHPDAKVLEKVMQSMRDVLVQGGPMKEMIIPRDQSKTLDAFRDPVMELGLLRLARGATTMWKQYVLLAPQQVSKYALNNVTSDFEAIITSKPGILLHLHSGYKMLRNYAKTNVMDERLHEAIERGVIHSALTMQEIQAMGAFTFDEAGNVVGTSFKGAALKPGKAYFNWVRRMILYRENTVRLAAYLYYRNQFVTKGRSVEDVGMDATKPWYAAGLTDNKDLSARYARDIMGDYGNVSKTGRMTAALMFPFWRWAESNIRRYVNRFRNAGLTFYHGRKVKGTTMATLTAARLAGQIAVFHFAVQWFNQIMWGDEEDDLSERQQQKPHIILGRLPGDTKKLSNTEEQEMGKILVLNYMGSFSDFGAWIGMEEATTIMDEVKKGRASTADVLTTIAKAPVNRFSQGLNPLFTTPIQMVLGREFYPDVFNPRQMRDPYHFTARAMSLHGVYPEMTKAIGTPVASRPTSQRVANILINQIDPAESAFLEIQSKGYEYKKRVLKEKTDFGVAGREGRLRYEFRRAVRMKDEAAAMMLKQILKEDYGMRQSQISEMMKGMEPLGMLNSRQRRVFMKTLDANEKKKYLLAKSFYRSMRGDALTIRRGKVGER